MHVSRETKILNTLCVLLFASSGFLRSIRGTFPTISDNAIICIFYLIATFIWMIQVQRRLIQPEERKYLTAAALLCVFLTVIRAIKYIFIPNDHFLSRLAWYLYYFPQTFMVLFMFFAVLHIGKQYDKPINKYWKLLYIPAFLIVLGILTNDLHEWAFRFDSSIKLLTASSHYTHGPLYFISMIWLIGLFGAMLAVAFTRCAVSKNRKKIFLPLIPLSIGAAYLLAFFITPDYELLLLYKTTEVICFVFPAFIECLILADLFPSNDCYRSLWNASDLGGGVMDNNGIIRYRSEKSIPVSPEEIRSATNKPIPKNGGNVYLQSHVVSGGYAYWTKNVSEINRINKKLAEMGDVIAEENAMLEAENSLAEKRIAINHQTKLYDTIAHDVAAQLGKLNRILASPSENEDVFVREMEYAAILTAYVKRRSNLLLLAHQERMLSFCELSLAVAESLEYISLFGIKTHAEYIGDGTMTREGILLAYKLFEYAVEAALPSAHGIVADISLEDTFTLRMEIGMPEKFIDARIMNDELDSLGGSLEVEIDDGTEFITLTLTGEKGGGSI